jgi:hypothetical protein
MLGRQMKDGSHDERGVHVESVEGCCAMAVARWKCRARGVLVVY